jgi:hypothetical protein
MKRTSSIISGISGLLLLSCSNSAANKTPGELQQLFTDYMRVQHPELRTGRHLVFIVNKVDCSPCIEAIETTMHADYRAKKKAVLFDYQHLYLKDVKVFEEHPKNIARYGLFSGDGNVCVFKNGELIAVEAMNIGHPEALVKKLKHVLSAKTETS